MLAVSTLLAVLTACSLQTEIYFHFFCTYDRCFLVSHIGLTAEDRELFYLLMLQQVMGEQGMHLLCSVKHVIDIT